MAQKRLRSVNFSGDEKMHCLSIIKKHKHIVENKVTDAVTSREKDNAWDLITTTFNSTNPACIPRTKESLKNFYENKKREVRKTVARERMELVKTGGGTAPEVKHDPTLDLAMSIINKKSVFGVPNVFDGDRIVVIVDELENSEEENVDPNICQDSRPSTSKGKEPLSTGDQQPSTSINIIIVVDYTANTRKDEPDWGDFKVPHLATPPTTNMGQGKGWASRRRPLLSAESNLSRKYEEVADVKKDIGNIQLQVLQKQLEYETQKVAIQKAASVLEQEEVRSRMEEIELRKQLLKLEIKLKEAQIKQFQSI